MTGAVPEPTTPGAEPTGWADARGPVWLRGLWIALMLKAGAPILSQLVAFSWRGWREWLYALESISLTQLVTLPATIVAALALVQLGPHVPKIPAKRIDAAIGAHFVLLAIPLAVRLLFVLPNALISTGTALIVNFTDVVMLLIPTVFYPLFGMAFLGGWRSLRSLLALWLGAIALDLAFFGVNVLPVMAPRFAFDASHLIFLAGELVPIAFAITLAIYVYRWRGMTEAANEGTNPFEEEPDSDS